MNDRFFDLGNLAVNNGLGEGDELRLLEAYLQRPPRDAEIASLQAVVACRTQCPLFGRPGLSASR